MLSGTDPTELLTTNPPHFSFTVDQAGFFSSDYLNVSGFTFLNLLITGPADGIASVGCSPDAIFASCSASIDRATDLVSFSFSGGPGIANNQGFFLTATNFTPGETLSGTSTDTVVTMPEPATIFLMLGAFGVTALAAGGRKFLKFRIGA
jgi:hypothetical protein